MFSKVFNRKFLIRCAIELAALGVVWLSLFLVFKHVTLYFDDFGNASLNYKYTVPGVNGTDFTWDQVMEWQSAIYQGWGGRVFYSTLFVFLLKTGPFWFFFIQTFLVTATFLFIAKLATRSFFEEIAYLFLCLLLYYLIPATIQCDGSNWASAAVCYIWPLFPMVVSAFCWFGFFREPSGWKKWTFLVLSALCGALAALGMEMFGGCLLVFYVVTAIIFRKKIDRKVAVGGAVAMALVLAATLVVLLAPGNFARQDIYPDFYNKPFIIRLFTQLGEIYYQGNFGDVFLFGLLLLLVAVWYGVRLALSLEKAGLRYFVFGAVALLVILWFVAPNFTSPAAKILFSILLLGGQVAFLFIHYMRLKRYEMIAIEILVFALGYCLVLSPSVGGRTLLPYYFGLFVVFCDAVGEVLECRHALTTVYRKVGAAIPLGFALVALTLTGAVNFRNAYVGYFHNEILWSHNEQVFSLAAAGKETNMYLYKTVSPYRSNMPYDGPQYAGMEDYMRSYYRIPDAATFIWRDDDGYSVKKERKAGVHFENSELKMGFYDQEPDKWRWTAQRFSFIAAPESHYCLRLTNVWSDSNRVTVFADGFYKASYPIAAHDFLDVLIDTRGEGDKVVFGFELAWATQPQPGIDARTLGLTAIEVSVEEAEKSRA